METDNNKSNQSGIPIIVALIGCLAIVLSALIGHWDKFRNPNQATTSVAEEIGHSEARAQMVEGALNRNEELIESQRESALRIDSREMASTLKDLADKTRRSHETVREMHTLYKDAIKTGERLKASKLRTGINEIVAFLNRQSTEFKLDFLLSVHSSKRRPTNRELLIIHDFIRKVEMIPPYGKRQDRRMTIEQVCELRLLDHFNQATLNPPDGG